MSEQKYTYDQVVMWAKRLAAGDTIEKIAEDYEVSVGSIRRQFKSKGLHTPSDYAWGVAEPPKDTEDAKEWAGVAEMVGPHLKRAVESLIQYGSVVKAAEALDLTTEALRNRLSEARYLAARRGWHPGSDMKTKQPAGFHVKGVSTYYSVNPITGEVAPKGQWVKTKRDEEHTVQQLLDAVSVLSENFQGKFNKVKSPEFTNEDLLAVYPIGDHHFGLYAWAEETGDADHTLYRGEAILNDAMQKLVTLAPPAKTALIMNLGDFIHADNAFNETAQSKNKLDVDTRWAKVLRIAIKALVNLVNSALKKHETVHIINEIGNHDDHSAIMLSLALDLYFANEPRVVVDTSPQYFHWFRFGQCLIGSTHGNNQKMSDLPGIMAHDRKEDWGQTTFRYFYVGHVHHTQVKEFPGVLVESFRVLSPNDSWHAKKGYRAAREMNLDVLHKEHGRIARHTVGISQIPY